MPPRTSSTSTTAPPAARSVPAPTASKRIVAIDVLRGFDMFWIVGGRELVLTTIALFAKPPAWIDHQLKHTTWEGFTAWDLIMPLFLFVVGTAMPFSFSRRLEQGQSKHQLYLKIVRRALVLFVVGMAVQGHLLDFKLATLHPFANTLQAIAVGYLIAGLLMLNVGVVGQLMFTILMLVGFWLLLAFVPLIGHGAGAFEEQANVALRVDQFVLGKFIDGTNPPYAWILSGMTFAATVLLGVLSGHVLRSRYSPIVRVVLLTVIGAACLGGGWAWAQWLDFPIIKHLWTSSMVLWAAGWSYLLLALFYLVIDVIGLRRWAFPFVVIGMNAITIYVAYDLVIPFDRIAKTLAGGVASHSGSAGPFVIALTTFSLVWLLAYHLYRQKIFWRI